MSDSLMLKIVPPKHRIKLTRSGQKYKKCNVFNSLVIKNELSKVKGWKLNFMKILQMKQYFFSNYKTNPFSVIYLVWHDNLQVCWQGCMEKNPPHLLLKWGVQFKVKI